MQQENNNPLYPVFFKLHKLRMLIVGAGEVGFEKMFFILKSSPYAVITMVAPDINPEITDLLEKMPNHKVSIIQKPFEATDIDGYDLIVAATNIRELNHEVHHIAKEKGKLINVADTPDLCDFYLGSIVTRGNLKVAISTNGQSPTLAKRFRQVLEEILPQETNQLLTNLKQIRDQLKGGFTEKVKQLNDITSSLVDHEPDH
ncbi:MAG: bifunctional precorrin-2 dehydrogenase/sirohydrochlorin ferrochelatase [Bacteroidota bacterium]